MRNKTIIRVNHNRKVSVVSRYHRDDTELSYKATDILTTILEKPDDWQTNPKHLSKLKKDGIKSVYSGLKELKVSGYVEHRLIRDEEGKIIRGEYIVYEKPSLNPKWKGRHPSHSPDIHFGNAASENAEKLPLHNTDSNININDSINGFQKDPVMNEPPSPPPPSEEKKVQKRVAAFPKKKQNKADGKSQKSSSCFLQSGTGKAKAANTESDNPTVLDRLMNIIPEQHRIKAVMQRVAKGLEDGHSEEYLESAIRYTTKHAKRSYGAYLGKTIDNPHWHEGAPQKPYKEAPQVPTQCLEQYKKFQQEEERQKQISARRQQIETYLESADIKALDQFITCQPLNDFEKSRFRKGKRDLLRMKFVFPFIDSTASGADSIVSLSDGGASLGGHCCS